MPWFKQLDFFARFLDSPARRPAPVATPRRASGRDHTLEAQARELLRSVGAHKLIPLVRVEWSARLRTSAGRADFHRSLITLNPRLHEHGLAEIDRTFRHELAHLLAHSRAGRRRIDPHGGEWRLACRDFGIADEQRCHTLPFPRQTRSRLFLYSCPRCAKDFPRVRRIRRGVACLACCREYNSGKYDKQFQLRLVRVASPA
jgi:predicted SprT family Zn-dependent metalloprotease